MTYSKYQFSFFRMIFGIYLLVHFSLLIPYSAEMFGSAGTLSAPNLNLTYGLFPSIFFLLQSHAAISVVLIIFCVLSIFFCIGFYRRVSAFLLWYGWASLFNANNFISNPGLPYVGWLLLACVIIPVGEPFSASKSENENWDLPKELYWGAWIILALGYSISGVGKILSPSWQDGTAFLHLIKNPLARDYWFRDFMVSLPVFVHKLHTWGALFFELSFAPLCLFPRGRLIAWSIMMLMHAGILCLVNFADLTFGMLMIHVFTFDPTWIKAKKSRENNKPVIFFDGVCGLCNSFIDFLFEEDKNKQYQFSPLQSEYASKNLSKDLLSLGAEGEFKSVVLLEDQKVYQRSAAVLRVLVSLGGIWSSFAIFFLIPSFFRDPIYNFIAVNRYKLFGKKDSCRMPTPSERSRFVL